MGRFFSVFSSSDYPYSRLSGMIRARSTLLYSPARLLRPQNPTRTPLNTVNPQLAEHPGIAFCLLPGHHGRHGKLSFTPIIASPDRLETALLARLADELFHRYSRC